MTSTCVHRLFDRYTEEKIDYSIRGDSLIAQGVFPKIAFPKGTNEVGYMKQNPYPSGLIEFVDLEIPRNELTRARKLALEEGFFFSPDSTISGDLFQYDRQLGLIRLLLYSGKTFDKVSAKTWSRGRLVCFVSPEGGGKTSLLSAVFTILENYPRQTHHLHFGSLRTSRLYRIYDLIKKLFSARWNLFFGRTVLTDRYIYLTFNHNPFLKHFLRWIAPTPDLVFVMKADYATLKRRRGPLCPPKQNVDKIYSIFSKIQGAIQIPAKKPLDYNSSIVMQKILESYAQR